jgi:RNA polymerase sigma factor (sigma-70 family)
MDDLELLWEFGRSGDQAAFARVAERHASLIYSAALRQVRDPHVAEDVTQAVLIILMNKAAKLPAGTIVPGWLVKVTRYAALDALKMEARRKKHEHKAASMRQETTTEDQPPRWDQVSPLLDEALTRLRMEDRDAVVLRYILGKTPEEIAWVMGVNEDAARKRVSRALERLRKIFAREGIRAGEASLGTVLAANALQPAPPAVIAMAKSIAAAGAAALATPPAVIAHGAVKSLFWAGKTKWIAATAALFVTVVASTLLLINGHKQVATNTTSADQTPKPASPAPAIPPQPQPNVTVSVPVTKPAPTTPVFDPRPYQHIVPTQTRLIAASSRHDLPAIEAFLKQGDDINAFSRDGINTTAITYAILRSENDIAYDTVKLLLDRGADPNARRHNGATPLILAIQHRSPKTARLLLNHGADVTLHDGAGDTAIDWAKRANEPALVSILEKSFASPTTRPAVPATLPTTQRATPAYDSSFYDRLPLTSPRLFVAATRNDLPAVEAFIKAGDDVNQRTRGSESVTPLIYAVAHPNDRGYAVAKLLLDHGASPNVRQGGIPALSRAVSAKSPRTIKLLLDHGADPLAPESNDKTALTWARQTQDDTIIQIIVEATRSAQQKAATQRSPRSP